MNRQEALEIYKDRSAKFVSTQAIQWKMNVSMWTLLALGIGYSPELEASFDLNKILIFKIGISLFVLAIHATFCHKVQSSLESDKAVKDCIVAQLNDVARNEIEVNLSLRPNYPIPWFWVWLQISVTAILCMVFIIV